MHAWFWRTHFVSFNLQEKTYFSRNPGSSDAEAVNIKEKRWWLKGPYEVALRASGFSQYNGSFKPCPLGTFTNLSSKGVEGCLNCPPGNF